jgi:hypothetical protein
MKRVKYLLPITLMLVQITFGQGNSKVDWFVFDSGFSNQENATTYSLSVIGQSTAGYSKGNNVMVTTGFLPGLIMSNNVSSQDDVNNILPKEFNLYQNYPNPFNPVTVIQYSIPNKSHVTIKVFDILGNKIMTLINEEKEAGFHEINFNGRTIASGMYIYRLIATPDGGQAGRYVSTKKMLLIK